METTGVPVSQGLNDHVSETLVIGGQDKQISCLVERGRVGVKPAKITGRLRPGRVQARAGPLRPVPSPTNMSRASGRSSRAKARRSSGWFLTAFIVPTVRIACSTWARPKAICDIKCGLFGHCARGTGL